MRVRHARLVVVMALGAVGLVGCGEGVLTSSPPYPALDPAQFQSGDEQSGLGEIPVDNLPATALATLSLVDAGGPFPDPDDGTSFGDPDGALPSQPPGYYRQYTVVQPGSDDGTSWYLVIGEQQETYWTTDGFSTFSVVRR
jgi:ribonuclease T1